MLDPELAQIVRDAQRVGATLKFGTITEDGQVKIDSEGILDDTPPGLVPQPYEPGRSVAILRMGPTTLVAGYLGGMKPGVDYQTPLTAGVDYQTPLNTTYVNPWWASQGGWSVIDNTHIYTYGKLVNIYAHMKSPSSDQAYGANGAFVIANLTNPAILPPIEVTFAWRTTSSFAGSGSFNTSGGVAINTHTAFTLPANSSLMFNISFLKP